jgi:hypothetical protein
LYLIVHSIGKTPAYIVLGNLWPMSEMQCHSESS